MLLEERLVVEDALDGAVDGQLAQRAVGIERFERREVVAAGEAFGGEVVGVLAVAHAHAAEYEVGQVLVLALLLNVGPDRVRSRRVDRGYLDMGELLLQGGFQRGVVEDGVAARG